MPYLARLSKAPNPNEYTPNEIAFIDQHFQINPQAVTLNGTTFTWEEVTGAEAAVAARANSPAGWFVRKLVYNGESRYHIALYAGRAEAVLPNIQLKIAQYIMQTIAYYAPKKLEYMGPADVAPISES
ncbi:MAG: hypothetical protein SF162_15875 [bacterium]|nr:hypothetical protein [bacterium]